jgi:hypothetical protein
LAEKSYKVVYLTALADRPTTYRRMRNWLRQGNAGTGGQLPDGSLLGPTTPLGPGDSDLFAIGQIDELKGKFSGKCVGIAGSRSVAEIYHSAGWRSFLLGDPADEPQGATALGSWEELPKKLAN